MKTTSKNGTHAVDCSTETLQERHENLNCDKGKGVNPPPGKTPAQAKRLKLDAKVELIRRARAGDQIAAAYAAKRQWPGFIPLVQLAEAE